MLKYMVYFITKWWLIVKQIFSKNLRKFFDGFFVDYSASLISIKVFIVKKMKIDINGKMLMDCKYTVTILIFFISFFYVKKTHENKC